MYKYLGLLVFGLFLVPVMAWGQDRDTTRQELDFERQLDIQQRLDRSMSGGIMTEMGTYQIPNETQYYHAPFKGQEYLDMAVEAYREEIKNRVGDNWYWQFLKAVSPFVRLELGAFQTLELEYPERDNPLWQSYSNDEKIE